MLTERKLTCEADAGGQEEATIKKNTILIAQLIKLIKESVSARHTNLICIRTSIASLNMSELVLLWLMPSLNLSH